MGPETNETTKGCDLRSALQPSSPRAIARRNHKSDACRSSMVPDLPNVACIGTQRGAIRKNILLHRGDAQHVRWRPPRRFPSGFMDRSRRLRHVAAFRRRLASAAAHSHWQAGSHRKSTRPKREAQHEANVEAAVAKIQNAAAVLQSSTSSLQRKHEAVSVVTHAAATDGRRYRVCYKVTADAIARAGCVPGLVALLADHFATE